MEQTVTIVNNSGKIISTGKHLFSIFKEAKASYSDKKETIKAERAISRSNTFAQAPSVHTALSLQQDEAEFRPRALSRAQTQYYYVREDEYTLYDEPRRRSYDVNSVASSRRSSRPRNSHYGGAVRKRSTRAPSVVSDALTEDNLKTHSKAASTRPSRPPTTVSRYRSPYAETVPYGQSNMDLTVVDRTVYQPINSNQTAAMVPRTALGGLTPESHLGTLQIRPKKNIDMNLAYGEIPPDLAYRTDLADDDSVEASALVRRVQGLLDEADCVHHSALTIIKRLQEKPEAAAAVALTLSELSAAAAKISPSVLGLLKGTSPAVFSLLACPQFLIASGLAAGVTVVMFGGWKIVKRTQKERALQASIIYEQAQPAIDMERPEIQQPQVYARSYDEALVLDDELSTIESWRRGIEPLGDEESADIELITPEADRVTRADERDRYEDQRDLDDTRSHGSARTHRSSKTERTSQSHKSHKSHKSHRSSKLRDDDDDGKSSKSSVRDGASTSSKTKSRSGSKLREDDRSSRHRSRDNVSVATSRPSRPKRQESDLFRSLFKKRNKDASHSNMVLA